MSCWGTSASFTHFVPLFFQSSLHFLGATSPPPPPFPPTLSTRHVHALPTPLRDAGPKMSLKTSVEQSAKSYGYVFESNYPRFLPPGETRWCGVGFHVARLVALTCSF